MCIFPNTVPINLVVIGVSHVSCHFTFHPSIKLVVQKSTLAERAESASSDSELDFLLGVPPRRQPPVQPSRNNKCVSMD